MFRSPAVIVAAMLLSTLSTALAADSKAADGKKPEGATADARAAEGKVDEAAVNEAHQSWNKALLHGDAAAVEKLLSDDFVLLDPGGNSVERSRLVDDLKTKTLQVNSIAAEDVKVRVHGAAAIVTCRETIKWQYNGNEINGNYIVTEVYAKHVGQWQYIGGHMSRAAE